MGTNSSRKLFIALLMPVALSGCLRFGVEVLEKTELKGTPFQNELARNYLAISKSEAALYDWIDADYFARKGLKAANGHDVEPDKVSHWHIQKNMVEDFDKAREQLVKTVDDQAKLMEPKAAAQAYTNFDCWLEQQEENSPTEEIEQCRNAFFEALDYLSVASEHAGKKSTDVEVDPMTFEEVKRKVGEFLGGEDEGNNNAKESEEEVVSSYAIFFDFGSIKINDEGEEVLDKVIEDLGGMAEYVVQVDGHTDASGDAEYNMRLSRKRAEIVKSALIEKGVAEKAIEVNSFGEDKQKIKTSDGKREPGNRVVEIFIH